MCCENFFPFPVSALTGLTGPSVVERRRSVVPGPISAPVWSSAATAAGAMAPGSALSAARDDKRLWEMAES